MTFYVVSLVIGYDILCHMSRRFWKFYWVPYISLNLSLAKLPVIPCSFCIRPLRLPGAVPNRRYRLKIYCKEFLRLLFWQRLRLLDWWRSQGVGTNTIGRLHKVMPKNVYAVVIWLTGLIFVELPACGVYTFWYMRLWGVKPGERPIWTVYELIDDTCDKIESGRRWLLQLLRVCFTPKTAKKSNPLPCCRLMSRAFRAELRVSFTVKKRKKYRL